MRRLSDEQVAQLVADRASGVEINQLAKSYRVDRTTVLAHLRRAGVPGRRRQGRILSPDQLRAAGEVYATGISLAAVGEQFNVDRRYLSKALQEAGFELRASGRRPVS